MQLGRWGRQERCWAGRGRDARSTLRRAVVLGAVAVTVAAPQLARAEGPTEVGRPWEPTPVSAARYDVRPPTVDPAVQRHVVSASDGTPLFVETWLPAPKDGNVPPARIPTILLVSPYARTGVMRHAATSPGRYLVERGYAYTQMHARGTGESGGCFEDISRQDADDVARVIEYLGRDAPWSDGTVGGIGRSQEAGRMLAGALYGDPARTSHLRAMVLASPVASRADAWSFDGVPYTLNAQYTQGSHLANDSLRSIPQPAPVGLAERLRCHPASIVGAADVSGDVTPYLQAHDLRRAIGELTVPTFMVHGHRDTDIDPLVQAGLFDRIPSTTAKIGLFGVFDHDWPDQHSFGVRPEWERADFLPMVTAWFDHHVQGLESGVGGWPPVQVQGTDGQWRAAKDWPTTGGPVGHLALGPAGTLGVPSPSGATAYQEGSWASPAAPAPAGTFAIWESQGLPGRLEMTGQPVLDLWVVLDQPDAHLAARIDTFDADGAPVPFGATQGFRSMRHLDPLVDNRFWQAEGRPAPVGAPVRVQLRFPPTDLVVPAGGRVRITLTGSLLRERTLESEAGAPVRVVGNPTLPSFSFTNVTVLHDCAHVSALRFLMPEPNPDLLDVREEAELGEPLGGRPSERWDATASGLATAPICGQRPARMPSHGAASRAMRASGVVHDSWGAR